MIIVGGQDRFGLDHMPAQFPAGRNIAGRRPHRTRKAMKPVGLGRHAAALHQLWTGDENVAEGQYVLQAASRRRRPVSITLPDAGTRYVGMQVVNQDQYTPATYYGAGTHTLTREVIGTRYAIAVVRFLVDLSNKEDVRQVHALQDAIKFGQERPGTFEIPHWDEASLKKIKATLLQLGTTVSDTRRMFGANETEVDPVRHLIGSAMLW